MICSNKIKLSDNEIAFLNKGPGYMMRCELDETEFETELEKMKDALIEDEDGVEEVVWDISDWKEYFERVEVKKGSKDGC